MPKITLDPGFNATPLFPDNPEQPTDKVARYKIHDENSKDPMAKFFGKGWVFKLRNGQYQRAHTDMDEFGNGPIFNSMDEIRHSIDAFENSDESIWAELINLVSALSPENLSCDGEASASYIRSKRAEINKKWAVCEKRLGRKVTEDEVWQHHMVMRAA